MIDPTTSARIAAKLREMLARVEAGDFVAVAIVAITEKGSTEVFADTGPSPLLSVALVGGMSSLATRMEVKVIQEPKGNA